MFLLTEANLGLLGLGVSEPMPSLGGMLSELQNYERIPDAPWVITPALCCLGITSLHLAIAEVKHGSSCETDRVRHVVMAANAFAEGELRFCLRADPKTFDPLLAAEEASERIRYLTGGVHPVQSRYPGAPTGTCKVLETPEFRQANRFVLRRAFDSPMGRHSMQRTYWLRFVV